MAYEQKFSKLSTTVEPVTDAPGAISEPDEIRRSPTDRRNVASIGLFIASFVSTILSGLFLVIAIVRPRYGFTISNRGSFSPSSAALLTAFLAKIIELTFVMTFLAFLGQILSRRALGVSGINLANLAMRSWILQPGTLLTQWPTVRVAGFSALGLLSLVAAVLSLLYTTASGALVQPQLRVAPLERTSLKGNVSTDFSNVVALKHACKTPITFDLEEGGSTCVQLKWSAACGYNFNNYMDRWTDHVQKGSQDDNRLPIYATLEGNINVTTAWLRSNNVTADWGKYHRIVNNITIAIPHRGVPAAARDPKNELLQPEDLDNTGSYSIVANVPNMFMNALCVNANRTELAPIVYETWRNRSANDIAEVVKKWPVPDLDATRNKTVFDGVFGWTGLGDINYTRVQEKPIFMKYPMSMNTIANHTSYPWGRDMVYILGKGPAGDDGEETENYFICSLKAGITEQCSTRYNASSSGQTLEALCGREYRYEGANSTGIDQVIPNWKDVGFDLLNAMDLQTGIIDGNSSYSRLFTQFQLQKPELNKALPSPAEALLSMGACTALDLLGDVPFVPGWNYTLPMLEEPQTQWFTITARITQYMSGSNVPYQQAFIIILALTFAINLFILAYYGVMIRLRFVVDICEPLFTFVLGYTSPPSQLFVGSAVRGLDRTDYARMFVVEHRDGDIAVVAKETASGIELLEGDYSRRRLHS